MDTISVLFSDKNILVVDKPFGISIHNNEDPQNLIQVLEKQLSIKKLFPVHRLDRETSGVQLFALNADHAHLLADQFQKRTTTKLYQGILRGKLTQTEGTWTHPLTDKAEGRKNPQGLTKDRVECETKFEVITSNSYFTHCQFHLITGRQHQIRKHTAIAKHAIVGDPRYNDPKYNEKISKLYSQTRMFLHCSSVDILSHAFKAKVPAEFALLMSNTQN